MKRYILALIAAAIPLVAYTEKTELRLAAGVSQIYICDSGPNAGGCYVLGLPVDAAHRAHVWPSIAGYNCGMDGDCTGIVDCTDEAAVGVPCSILINREYGDVKLWSRAYLANDTSPGTWSSKLLIPGISGPCETATFVVPSEFHGFENKQICKTASIAGGEDTSSLQLWMHLYNWRNGAISVQAGSAPYVTFLDNPVLHFDCLASNVCTIITKYPHGYAANQLVQFNGYLQGVSGGPSFAAAQINNTQTVQSVVDPLTFTITEPVASCNGSHCTFNSPDMRDNGLTTSPFYYVSEDRWMGGLSGIRQAMEVALPVPAGAVTAGTTNTLRWKFNAGYYPDYSASGILGGYILRWNLVQPWIQINQIVVTGNATATVTLASPVPASWHNGDTVIIRDAPGPEWLFSHERVISNISGSTFQFTLSQPTVGTWTVPNGTYVVPTSKDTTIQTQPAMYAGRALIPTSSFRQLNPSADYTTGTGNAGNGAVLFSSSTQKQLVDYFPNHTSGGKCSSCHSDTGFDQKYFALPPVAQVISALERGLKEQDGWDIAAYIKSLSVPYTGRPWDPPYQPGIGLDSTPIMNMAAGAGLQWKLNYDQDMRWFLVPGCTPTSSGCTGGSYAKWAPGGSGGGAANSIINTRELPTALQMPQWLRWLPMIAPEDQKYILKDDLVAAPAFTDYTTYKANTSTTTLSGALAANCTSTSITIGSGINFHNNDFIQILDLTQANKYEYMQITSGAGTTTPTVSRCQKGSAAQAWSGGEQIANFTVYWNTNGTFSNLFNDISGECGAGCGSPSVQGYAHYASFHRPEFSVSPSPCNGINCAGYWWPSMIPVGIISSYNWAQVKTWQLVNTNYLYNMLDRVYIAYHGFSPNARAAAQDQRGFAFKWPFNRGPHKLIGGQQFLGNTGAISDRFFNCDTEIWYRLPGVIDNGNRMGGGDVEYDQNYYWAFFQGGSSCGSTRPHFYDVTAIGIFLTQQMWGWPTLPQMTLNFMNGINATKTAVWYNDLFVPEAEEGEVFGQVAQQYYNISSIDTQNTSEWQTFFNTIGSNCSTSGTTTANATTGFNSDGCYLDEIAYALSVWTYYGANSTLMSNIVAWLNPVWSAFSGAGNTLAKYTNAANVAADCSRTNIGGHAPSSVSCTGPLWP